MDSRKADENGRQQRQSERGAHIRSLLIGSGAKSVSSFSYMRDVDYGAAQNALRRHLSAAERGKHRGRALQNVAKTTRDKRLCAEHRAVHRRESKRLASAENDVIRSLALLYGHLFDSADPALQRCAENFSVWQSRPALTEIVSSRYTGITQTTQALPWEPGESEEILMCSACDILTLHRTLRYRANLMSQQRMAGRGGRCHDDKLRDSLSSAKALLNELQGALQTEADSLAVQVDRFAAGVRDMSAAAAATGSEYGTRLLPCCPEPSPVSAVLDAGADMVSQIASWKWPDRSMLDAGLRECEALNTQLEANMDALLHKYKHVLRPDTSCWPCSSADYFSGVIEHYELLTKNRYQLMMDRLRRQFPAYKQHEIDQQYQWCVSHRFFHRGLRSATRDASSRRQDLLTCLRSGLQEAQIAELQAQATAEKRRRQSQACQELNKRLSKLRAQREEEDRLQNAILAYEQAAAQRQGEAREEARQKIRETERKKVDAFRKAREEKLRKEHEENVARLANLQADMAEQARHDQERVAYRQHQLQLREVHLREEKDRQMAERERAERQLDALRAQVVVNVPDDPLRHLQDTKSFSKHRHDDQDAQGDMIPIQAPLFGVTSFTSDKVMADPRMRVYEMLQAQGLHQSEYAGRVIASLPPVKPPRPDQKSTLSFGDH